MTIIPTYCKTQGQPAKVGTPHAAERYGQLAIMKYLLTIALFFISITYGLSQVNWKIFSEIKDHEYYMFNGEIDGKYPIKMYLTHSGFCGEGNNNRFKAIQLKGWYYYESQEKKLPLIGSMKYDNPDYFVKLYVPQDYLDTLDSENCSLTNYSEMFFSEKCCTIKELEWKTNSKKESLPVTVEPIHKFSYMSEVFVGIEMRGIEMCKIHIPELEGSFFESTVLASKEIDNEFYTIMNFNGLSNPAAGGSGYCGAGIEAFIGFFHINKSFEIENQEIIQYHSCYKNIFSEYEFDPEFPENGIRIKK